MTVREALKVQDGCDYKCTYCTIPKAKASAEVIDWRTWFKGNGDRGPGDQEIVLTGVNTGDYGKGEFGNKKHEHTFMDLLQALDRFALTHPHFSRAQSSARGNGRIRCPFASFRSSFSLAAANEMTRFSEK